MAKTITHPFLLSLTFSLLILISASPESEILLTFKSHFTNSMNTLSSWSNTSSTHHCNWTGITCSSLSVITSVDLESLNLSGEISPSICELHSLAHLNVADNLFNIQFPLYLSECISLETLNLSGNLIWGKIPDGISQFRSLKVLDLSRNHVEGKIPEGIGSLDKLQVLDLGSNLLSGSDPFVFGNLSELVVLDLSQNPFLASELNSDIGMLVKLEQLLLQKSALHGEIPDSFVGLINLRILDLSQNILSGTIPQKLCVSLKSLTSFDVSQNMLSGSFPNGICFAKGLVNFSVHTNLFNGPIQENIGDCFNLEKFQVQDNDFSGDFPNELWSLPKIKLIRAENNRFSGDIPDSISMAAQLDQVQIDNNSFTGKIPWGLGLVKSLYRFSASLNGLYGDIPPNFCDSPIMSILNLSHNSLSGIIPELKKCKKLVSLSLADNSLVGEIPPSLGDLPVLTYLDLSENNLTGLIPQELQSLKLALFNVSFNRLSGKVPFPLISGLPASFLQGNKGLCGPGLPNSCSEKNKERHKTDGLSTLSCVVIFIAIITGIVIVIVGYFKFPRRFLSNSESGVCRSVFFYPLRVTEQDLIMWMNEKNALGTCGAFGKVYAISLPSGELVAVKKLVNFGTLTSKSLKAEIKTLAKIRHKNIAKILGFCHSEDEIFLIYEFVQKGSLGDLIDRPNFQLPWNVRLRIAIGVAQGLAYLHKDYSTPVLHRNVKSKNILLDADFEPKLTDFALDRIVGEAAFQLSITSEPALSCYMASENAYSKKATEQKDIYSFGIVLLELVTGRRAEQTDSEDSLDIVKWVRRKINITNGALQVLDAKISNDSSVQEDMLGVLDIAVRCTSVMPEKRHLSMFEVVRELQSLSFTKIERLV